MTSLPTEVKWVGGGAENACALAPDRCGGGIGPESSSASTTIQPSASASPATAAAASRRRRCCCCCCQLLPAPPEKEEAPPLVSPEALIVSSSMGPWPPSMGGRVAVDQSPVLPYSLEYCCCCCCPLCCCCCCCCCCRGGWECASRDPPVTMLASKRARNEDEATCPPLLKLHSKSPEAPDTACNPPSMVVTRRIVSPSMNSRDDCGGGDNPAGRAGLAAPKFERAQSRSAMAQHRANRIVEEGSPRGATLWLAPSLSRLRPQSATPAVS